MARGIKYKPGDIVNCFELIKINKSYPSTDKRRYTWKCPYCGNKEYYALLNTIKTSKSCGCIDKKYKPGDVINGFELLKIDKHYYATDKNHYTWKCPYCDKDYHACPDDIKKNKSCGCIKYKPGDIVNGFELIKIDESYPSTDKRRYTWKCPYCGNKEFKYTISNIRGLKSCDVCHDSNSKYSIGAVINCFKLMKINKSYPSTDKRRYTWKCPYCKNEEFNGTPSHIYKIKSCGCLPTRSHYKNKEYKGYLLLRYEYTGRDGKNYFLVRNIETNEELVLSPEDLI